MSNKAVEEKRKSVLKKAYLRAQNPDDPFTEDQLKDLHEKIASRATASRHEDFRHKWILKLTNVFSNMAPVNNYRDRLDLAMAVERTYRDNAFAFKSVDPDSCFMSLQRKN